MPFHKLRQRFSTLTLSSKSSNKLHKSNPSDSRSSESSSRTPDASKAFFRKPHIQHPAVRPLESSPCPRSTDQSPPRFSLASSSSGQSHPVADRHLDETETHAARREDACAIPAHQLQQRRRESIVSEIPPALELSQSPDPVNVDYTVHQNPPVIHEVIKPHIHTIYEPQRTRSVHLHEYRYLDQPVVDPTPRVLPTQHYFENEETGELVFLGKEGEDDIRRNLERETLRLGSLRV